LVNITTSPFIGVPPSGGSLEIGNEKNRQ